jgi:hypothetical protein
MAATPILCIVIIASEARRASSPNAAICHQTPQRPLHQPQALCVPPLPTMALQ